jgi:hypothetical protein
MTTVRLLSAQRQVPAAREAGAANGNERALQLRSRALVASSMHSNTLDGASRHASTGATLQPLTRSPPLTRGVIDEARPYIGRYSASVW